MFCWTPFNKDLTWKAEYGTILNNKHICPQNRINKRDTSICSIMQWNATFLRFWVSEGSLLKDITGRSACTAQLVMACAYNCSRQRAAQMHHQLHSSCLFPPCVKRHIQSQGHLPGMCYLIFSNISLKLVDYASEVLARWMADNLGGRYPPLITDKWKGAEHLSSLLIKLQVWKGNKRAGGGEWYFQQCLCVRVSEWEQHTHQSSSSETSYGFINFCLFVSFLVSYK